MIFFFRSVKFRLTLGYALAMTVFLSLFAFLMYSELSRSLYRDTDKTLAQQVRTLEHSLHQVLRPLQEQALESGAVNETASGIGREALIEAVRKWEEKEQFLRRSTMMIRLLSFDHSLLISNLKGWEKEIIFPDFERDSAFMEKGISWQTIHFRKRPIRLHYALMKIRHKPVFVIQTAIPMHEVERSLSRLLVIISIWIPVAVLAAGIAGWFLARRFLRPIDMMIREARQITAAYLKGRLPRSKTGDELDRLAATLNGMMDRLENSTRAVQEFSSNVSHELKTPLAIIRGEVDLALRKSRSAEDLLETLRIIEEEVNGLIRLVDDLMLLVRSDSQQLKFETKPVSLGEVLEYVYRRFQDRAEKKKIELSYHFDRDVEIKGDEVYLKRVFSNLLDNAIKFTEPGGRVSLSLEDRKGRVEVKVKDTGIGMAPEIQGRVFSRFYRSDQARTEEGAGLGLNIAKAICDVHGATLTISSQAGKGALVIVSFPVPHRRD